jgi:Zn finger protein HypA/HybF involved in hydrogenase expression
MIVLELSAEQLESGVRCAVCRQPLRGEAGATLVACPRCDQHYAIVDSPQEATPCANTLAMGED